MKRFWLGIAAVSALSACSGGNPFTQVTDTDVPITGIPEVISSDLEGISYDPVNETLTVRGISLDDTPFEAVYRRRANLDVGAYEAYTQQDSSLDRHSTAYVRNINGTRGAIVVTGGQFEHYFGGGVYGRSGSFAPPDPNGNAVVSYAGDYVGLLNAPGDGGDLLPVSPGTPNSVRPVQAAEVTGRVLINADFADNQVNGIVFNRNWVDNPGTTLSDLALKPTAIDPTNGTFEGEVTINLQNRGTYGGIFGGTDASEVAGAMFAKDHIDGVTNEEEYGLFVLQQCGTPGADALCNQPVP